MQSRSTRRSPVPLAGACALVGALLVGCIETSDPDPVAWEPAPGQELSPIADGYLADYGVSCRVDSIETDAGTIVRMTLANDNEADVRFLEWQTLWDPYYPPFEFPSSDERVSYRGWRAARGEPTDDAFLPIPHNSSVTTEYLLADHYVAQQAGDYQIRLRTPVLVLRANGEQLTLQHACGEGSVYVGDEVEDESDGFSSHVQELQAHSGCNDNAERILENAFAVAHSAVTTASRMAFEGSAIYEEWYGDWNEWNGDEVTAHMDQILGSAWDSVFRCGGDGEGSVFNCCSDPGANACWLDAGPFGDRLYVCTPWFMFPPLSVEAGESQAGVLVHELAHAATPNFVWAGYWKPTHPFGTDDLGYGTFNARTLADACAGERCAAVRNSENYEHFVAQSLVTAIVTSAM